MDTQTQPEKNVHQITDTDKLSKPIYSYEDAIKPTVYVETHLDSGRDGEMDRIAADIIRPKETGLKVPVIIDASPYYERIGVGMNQK